MAASTNNYTIGKGVVSIKKSTDVAYIDMGNCSSFEFTPTIEKLEHYSSRSGIKKRDKTVVLSKSGTLKLTLDEWSDENIALAVLGTADSTGAISIFTENAISCSIKIVENNEVGVSKTWEFPLVDIIPSGTIGLIGDDWRTMELEGEVSADDVTGSFGSVTDNA